MTGHRYGNLGLRILHIERTYSVYVYDYEAAGAAPVGGVSLVGMIVAA